jgi:hypothetical protein
MMVQVPDPTTGVFPAKVAEVPQIVWSVPALETVGVWLTVTVTEAQVVVLQAPEYCTKYVVVAVGETVIEAPVPAAVPPQEPVNHCATAPVPSEPPTTVSVVELPVQIKFVPEMLVGATLEVWNVITTSSVEGVQGAFVIVQRRV